jgi:hypothetical protein
LLSRQGIVTGQQTVTIDGITSGYIQIQQEITQRIGGIADRVNSDVVLLAHHSTYIALLFAILHAQLMVSLGLFGITVENEETGLVIPLILSRLLVFFVVNLIMIFPPLIVWRIFLQRRSFARQLGMRTRGFLEFLRLSVAILLSIIAILWLLLTPILEIGADEVSEDVKTVQETLGLTELIINGLMGRNISDAQNRLISGLPTHVTDRMRQMGRSLNSMFLSPDTQARQTPRFVPSDIARVCVVAENVKGTSANARCLASSGAIR